MRPARASRFTDRIGEIVAFVLGGISAVFAYRLTRSPFKYFSPLLGAIALVSLVFSASGHDLGLGVGGMERMVVCPIVIWLIMLGGYLMATDSAKLTPA